MQRYGTGQWKAGLQLYSARIVPASLQLSSIGFFVTCFCYCLLSSFVNDSGFKCSFSARDTHFLNFPHISSILINLPQSTYLSGVQSVYAFIIFTGAKGVGFYLPFFCFTPFPCAFIAFTCTGIGNFSQFGVFGWIVFICSCLTPVIVLFGSLFAMFFWEC